MSKKALILDNLIQERNDIWKLSYSFSNWEWYGRNGMLTLLDANNPDFEIALCDMVDSIYEDFEIVDSFVKEYPETPFVVFTKNIQDGITVMEERLEKMITLDADGTSDYTRFLDHYVEFDKFLKVCKWVDDSDDESRSYEGCFKGWRYLYNTYLKEEEDKKKEEAKNNRVKMQELVASTMVQRILSAKCLMTTRTNPEED